MCHIKNTAWAIIQSEPGGTLLANDVIIWTEKGAKNTYVPGLGPGVGRFPSMCVFVLIPVDSRIKLI